MLQLHDFPYNLQCRVWTGSEYLDLTAPSPNAIHLVDIARSLSREGRFAGAAHVFYSVADHSCYMATLAGVRGYSDEIAAMALMHDAAEAYLGHLPTPVKSLCPEYRAIRARLWGVIAQRFGFPETLPAEIHTLDHLALGAEVRDLLSSGCDWPDLGGMDLPDIAAMPSSNMDDGELHFLTYADALGVREVSS